MLELFDIQKNFGTKQVLKNISFQIKPGTITGFVGGNGAGKTTTMRIILGVLSASGGEVLYEGNPITAKNRRAIGYMPEERGLYPKMKIVEQLTYLGQLHGLSKADASNEALRLLERFNLADRAKDSLEKLSLGNQQRVQIAAALVQKPQMLILDEPFSGLDMLAVDTVLEILREYTEQGVGILFSSHQLEIVERLSQEIVIIADGQIKVSGDKEKIRLANSELLYEIKTAENLEWLKDFAGIQVCVGPNTSVIENSSAVAAQQPVSYFTETVEGAAQQVLAKAISQTRVYGFTQVRPSLSAIFREVVR